VWGKRVWGKRVWGKRVWGKRVWGKRVWGKRVWGFVRKIKMYVYWSILLDVLEFGAVS
jgi:hypothetical protein